MTLITCPECSNKVSSQAETCPQCGYRLTSQQVHTQSVEHTTASGAKFGLGCVLAILASIILLIGGWFLVYSPGGTRLGYVSERLLGLRPSTARAINRPD